MSLFGSIKLVLLRDQITHESITDKDCETFERIVTNLTLIYKSGQARETYIMLEFSKNVSQTTSKDNQPEYKVFGNVSKSEDLLYLAFKRAVTNGSKEFKNINNI